MPKLGVVLLALMSLVAGACASSSDRAPDSLTGTITEIERGDSDEIVGLVLEAEDEEWTIRIAEDVDYGFDLEHLQEHMDQDLPVTVGLEQRDGDLVALTVEDS